jgi:hypothetical protein
LWRREGEGDESAVAGGDGEDDGNDEAAVGAAVAPRGCREPRSFALPLLLLVAARASVDRPRWGCGEDHSIRIGGVGDASPPAPTAHAEEERLAAARAPAAAWAPPLLLARTSMPAACVQRLWPWLWPSRAGAEEASQPTEVAEERGEQEARWGGAELLALASRADERR